MVLSHLLRNTSEVVTIQMVEFKMSEIELMNYKLAILFMM